MGDAIGTVPVVPLLVGHLVVVRGASSISRSRGDARPPQLTPGFGGSGRVRPLEEKAVEVDSFVLPSGENTVRAAS